MIKSTDISIGNYLNIHNDIVIVQLSDIAFSEYNNYEFNKSYSPIDITLHILDVCNFIYSKNGIYLHSDMFSKNKLGIKVTDSFVPIISIGDDPFVCTAPSTHFFNIELNSIKYLHELQNLFYSLYKYSIPINIDTISNYTKYLDNED